MKLKGSVTIEACVIIPVFTIIVVWLVLASADCHDRAIINSISDKMCIEAEFMTFDGGKYDDRLLEEYSARRHGLIENATIKIKSTDKIKEDLLHLKTDSSSVLKNNPVQYVRVTDAVKKLMKEKK